jgi:hypothetical protein
MSYIVILDFTPLNIMVPINMCTEVCIIAAERSEAAPYSWRYMTFLLFRAQSPAELYWGNILNPCQYVGCEILLFRAQSPAELYWETYSIHVSPSDVKIFRN